MRTTALSDNHQHVVGSIEQVYASALLDSAEQTGQQNELAEELGQLTDLLRAEPGLDRLLSTRSLSTAQKADCIERTFQGRVSDLLHRFLQVVNQKQRLDLLRGIARAYVQLMEQRHGIVEADVFAASRLPEDQARAVAESLGKALHHKVVLHQYTDPRLIGGLKIRVGDQVYDGTVQTQLRKMQQKLLASGREQARSRLEALIE